MSERKSNILRQSNSEFQSFFENFFRKSLDSNKTNYTFSDILSKKIVDLQKLQKHCFFHNFSLPEEDRPLIWMLLLGYLNPESETWEETSLLNKQLYEKCLNEVFIKNEMNEKNEKNGGKIDHPLNIQKTSCWNIYFNDRTLWNTIEKDTKRTRSDLKFFKELIQKDYPTLKKKEIQINEEKTDDERMEVKMERKIDVLTRMLFVYAKTHPFIDYVQGMNEILATLFYCFSKNKRDIFGKTLESDTYICFCLLMSELKENFTKVKDCSLLALRTNLKRFDKLLKRVDPKLWDHLQNNNICTEIYSTRWLLLLLTQDFSIDDIAKLWDMLLSFYDKQKFINYLSLAIILNFREGIINGTFEEIHILLKQFSSLKLEKIMCLAVSLSEEFN